MMSLSSFLKILYVNPFQYRNLSNKDKAPFAFMTNRLHAIRYPLIAERFNFTKISPVHVVDYWQSQVSGKFNSVPAWMQYVSFKSNAEKKWSINEDAQKHFRSIHECSLKDFEDLKRFFPKETLLELKRIESLLKA